MSVKLSGSANFRIALLDRSAKRRDDNSNGRVVRRIPWNLVGYQQSSKGASIEPVDAQKDWLTGFGNTVPEITDVQFLDELSFFNGQNGIGGHIGNKTF
jgi:hypothetical protein